MAKNDFLPFATADGANVLSADEYQKLTSRSNGFSAGVARSQELNTVWRQASVIAHVVAQFIADTNNSDVADNGDLDALKTGLISALSKNVSNTVPAASTTVAGITKLSSATNSNDETMAATPKAVKAAYDLASMFSVDALYPIGIVTWFAQNKDPNTLFPGTTWKYIGENRTIRLAAANGSDVMTTGGSDAVTLATGNLPAHGHGFSATTGSFDYGTKSSNSAGAHTHTVSGTAASAGDHAHKIPSAHGTGAGSAYVEGPYAADEVPTRSAGAHTHNISGTAASAGAHTHTVAIGSHTHTVSGTTANTGTGTAFAVTNAFVKLMGWYRSA
nr:phage tail protein [Serratia symbiotica]